MLKEIYERQSIRKYKPLPVEGEKLEEVLRAGMNAPSARNTQSTRYVVITKRTALDDMINLQPYMGMMKQAPCAIMVLGHKACDDSDDYLYVNASAAIENMLIEAVHQGLSTCWCAIGPNPQRIENFKSYYQLDDNLLPVAMIAIGYGDEVKEKVDRFDPLKISYIK